MNYIKTIDTIVAKLEQNNKWEAANKIKSLENASSVGSELLMSITHELLIYVNTNEHFKTLIGEEVFELKRYCWSIGLNVK